jgi:hypothetical protein
MFAALWMAALAAKAEPVEIRVRLQTYVPISTSTLERAKGSASSILEQAGIRTFWSDCATRQGEVSRDPACSQPLTPLDLQMRILTEEMAKHTRRGHDSLGYALISGKFDSIAGAYFHRALDLEAGNLASRSDILGAIMAHEIGHLLEVTSHSDQGLMRAFWDDRTLKTLARGRLWFTREQAGSMHRALGKRREAAGGTVPETNPRASLESSRRDPEAFAPAAARGYALQVLVNTRVRQVEGIRDAGHGLEADETTSGWSIDHGYCVLRAIGHGHLLVPALNGENRAAVGPLLKVAEDIVELDSAELYRVG